MHLVENGRHVDLIKDNSIKVITMVLVVVVIVVVVEVVEIVMRVNCSELCWQCN